MYIKMAILIFTYILYIIINIHYKYTAKSILLIIVVFINTAAFTWGKDGRIFNIHTHHLENRGV